VLKMNAGEPGPSCSRSSADEEKAPKGKVEVWMKISKPKN
jgi:hypothetical protein